MTKNTLDILDDHLAPVQTHLGKICQTGIGPLAIHGPLDELRRRLWSIIHDLEAPATRTYDTIISSALAERLKAVCEPMEINPHRNRLREPQTLEELAAVHRSLYVIASHMHFVYELCSLADIMDITDPPAELWADNATKEDFGTEQKPGMLPELGADFAKDILEISPTTLDPRHILQSFRREMHVQLLRTYNKSCTPVGFVGTKLVQTPGKQRIETLDMLGTVIELNSTITHPVLELRALGWATRNRRRRGETEGVRTLIDPERDWKRKRNVIFAILSHVVDGALRDPNNRALPPTPVRIGNLQQYLVPKGTDEEGRTR